MKVEAGSREGEGPGGEARVPGARLPLSRVLTAGAASGAWRGPPRSALAGPGLLSSAGGCLVGSGCRRERGNLATHSHA